MRLHELRYPASGENLACWIGYIAECRRRGSGTSIAGSSLSGYLSGIRTSLVAPGHPRLPTIAENFALRSVYKAYLEWDGNCFPRSSPLRVAVPAHVLLSAVQPIMESDIFTLIRALAMVTLARCHGLRASSVENIPFSGFELTRSGWTVLVTRLKNHTVAQARKYGSRAFRSMPLQGIPVTCRDVMSRWLYRREERRLNSPLLFGDSEGLDESLKRVLLVAQASPPTGCSFTSHSLRYAAFTESCLRPQANMAVLIMQYNWVALQMPRVYFDHRLTLTPAVEFFASQASGPDA